MFDTIHDISSTCFTVFWSSDHRKGKTKKDFPSPLPPFVGWRFTLSELTLGRRFDSPTLD